MIALLTDTQLYDMFYAAGLGTRLESILIAEIERRDTFEPNVGPWRDMPEPFTTADAKHAGYTPEHGNEW